MKIKIYNIFNKMNYEISIISYKRHKELPLKSLKFLKENNVPISLIRIFLQDEEDISN